MQHNLVIVESPSKAKTIEKYLGDDFKVLSSKGHVRDLSKKGYGVDIEHGYQPVYEIIDDDKKKLIAGLKTAAKHADAVWLASDEDREGEAIAWHLAEVLGLDKEHTRRIVFHEITKTAIEEAVKNPRTINMNLVDAQQARRVLDRLVGFELSPILWKKIKPSLSAGRVQSVAVRLIVDREREIQQSSVDSFYRLILSFKLDNGQELKAELGDRIADKKQARELLEKCSGATFHVTDITTKPIKRAPYPPFTTSTLQQEASRRLNFSVSQTMRLAQALYESGKITYMRTDSVHLSDLALATSKKAVEATYGKEYAKMRQFQTHTKGAQEAHEAIRPSYIDQETIEGTVQEKHLYDLIRRRTLASQMADAEVEKTTITIASDSIALKFTAEGERILFDGFMRAYEAEESETANVLLPKVSQGEVLTLGGATATERFTLRPPRYTEGSLIHKLEELGIGRPSTFAAIISTIQQRDYVVKGNRDGEKREYNVMELGPASRISDRQKTEMTGVEKGKLFPTDTGMVVNDFLMAHFPNIMDYAFTARVEDQFDEVAEGKEQWNGLIDSFYRKFHPDVEMANAFSKEKVGARILGTDPKSGRPVSVRIGRFGPIAQIGTAEDSEKPLFASLKKEQSIETITLEETLDLFKLPRTVGKFEDKTVVVGTGRFGFYIRHDNAYVSLPKGYDPMSITLDECESLILAKREAESKRVIKTFEVEPVIRVVSGRFGAYLSCDGVNYKLNKAQRESAAELTVEECLAVIDAARSSAKAEAKAGSRSRKKPAGKTETKKKTKK